MHRGSPVEALEALEGEGGPASGFVAFFGRKEVPKTISVSVLSHFFAQSTGWWAGLLLKADASEMSEAKCLRSNAESFGFTWQTFRPIGPNHIYIYKYW